MAKLNNYTPEERAVQDKGLYRVAQSLKTHMAKSLLEHNNDGNSHPDKVKADRIAMYNINKTTSTLTASGSKYKIGPAYLEVDPLTYVPILIEEVDSNTGEIVNFNFPTEKIYTDMSITETKEFTIKQFDNDTATLSLVSVLESIDINRVNLLEEILDLRTIGMIYYTKATANSSGGSGGDEPGVSPLPGKKVTDIINIEEGRSQYTINHGLGSSDLMIQTYMNGEQIYVDTKIDSPDVVTFDFGDAIQQLIGEAIKIVLLNINESEGTTSYKFAGDIQIKSTESFYNITHNLNTEDIFVQINIAGEMVFAKVQVLDKDHVKIDIGSAATEYDGQTARVIIV